MSTVVLPSLAGLGFDVVRTAIWDTVVQTAISGNETRIAHQASPRWRWELTYNVLRSSAALAEFQQLVGFFNLRQGKFDTFLYSDADDNNISAQLIGTGDGSTTGFSLVRSFGGFYEFVLAPKTVTAVYVNGMAQSGNWTVAGWGTSAPGIITFTSAPPSGAAITADFSYYFPCRMSDDSVSFSMFLSQHYRVKKFSFISVKN